MLLYVREDAENFTVPISAPRYSNLQVSCSIDQHSVPMHANTSYWRSSTNYRGADVGDMNMLCTAIFGKARQGIVYASF